MRKNGVGRWMVVVVAIIACAGCFPARFVTRPGVRGSVTDAGTAAPLAGVQVRAWRLDWDPAATEAHPVVVPREPAVSAVTGPDGRFDIPKASKWGIFIIPMDVMVPGVRVVIEAPGHGSWQIDYPPILNGGRGTYDAGTIVLNGSSP